MPPYPNGPNITPQNLSSQINADVLIIPQANETSLSVNHITKAQNQIKEVNSAIPTSSFTIYCPTYSVKSEDIYQTTPSQFPSQSFINSEIRMLPMNSQSCIKTVSNDNTYHPPGSSSNGRPFRLYQTKAYIPPREGCSRSSAGGDVPRKKCRRQTPSKIRPSSKDLIQEFEKNIALVRPTSQNNSKQSPTLRTASAMSGIKEWMLGSESGCCFRKSSSSSPDVSYSLQEFSVRCPKCIAHAKEMESLIKCLITAADTPTDLVNILELKRLLVEMDNQNFIAIMIKLLRTFPKEMIRHITA
ncbi:unnamed protein product [Hymenolepis diminuta]|nr:unnamed protein product [Hymenolepis diminuta]